MDTNTVLLLARFAIFGGLAYAAWDLPVANYLSIFGLIFLCEITTSIRLAIK